MNYRILIKPEYDGDTDPGQFGDCTDETVQWIKEQLWNNNVWAWCTVTVSIDFPYLGIFLSESIRTCSYESEEDFKNSRCYDSMVVMLKQRVVDACTILTNELVIQ
jgi:hypothetical protein